VQHAVLERREKEEEEQVQTPALLRQADVGEQDLIPAQFAKAAIRMPLAPNGNRTAVPGRVQTLLIQRTCPEWNGKLQRQTEEEEEKPIQTINARAFTVGNNIAFGSWQYSSHSHDGRQLLAHGLTHTIQQTAAEKEGESAISLASTEFVQRDSPAAAPPAPAAPVPVAAGTTPAAAPTQDTAGMSPEDARRLVYARTTLSQIPPLDARDKDTLQQATKDAVVFSFIEKRN